MSYVPKSRYAKHLKAAILSPEVQRDLLDAAQEQEDRELEMFKAALKISKRIIGRVKAETRP